VFSALSTAAAAAAAAAADAASHSTATVTDAVERESRSVAEQRRQYSSVRRGAVSSRHPVTVVRIVKTDQPSVSRASSEALNRDNSDSSLQATHYLAMSFAAFCPALMYEEIGRTRDFDFCLTSFTVLFSFRVRLCLQNCSSCIYNVSWMSGLLWNIHPRTNNEFQCSGNIRRPPYALCAYPYLTECCIPLSDITCRQNCGLPAVTGCSYLVTGVRCSVVGPSLWLA